jgi:hypothetical protein
MGHGPEQQIEHAQHAEHASHNPFDRRVTVSIAVVAAILAAVTMLGHKAHNETLRLQGEAIKEQSLVGVLRTDTADQYAFYQAQKNRGVLYEGFLALTAMLPVKKGTDEEQQIAKKATKNWEEQSEKYKVKLPEMLKDADALKATAEKHQEKAEKAVEDSHVEHAKANRFDLGELGLQLGVVLCSMAILTKSRNFWCSGLLCALAGFLVALSGVFGWFMDLGHH